VLVTGGGMSIVEELCIDLPPAATARTFFGVFRTSVIRNKHGDESGVCAADRRWEVSKCQ
jgi:hypothetical protein